MTVKYIVFQFIHTHNRAEIRALAQANTLMRNHALEPSRQFALTLPLRVLHSLIIGTALLATLCALVGWDDLFRLTKPLPMALAVVSLLAERGGDRRARHLLTVAMTAALAGDLLLLNESWFLFGLLAFLVTHLTYLALFRREAGWFPSRLALAAILILAAAVLAWEFPLLPPGLIVPVAIYTGVIALMVAQASGRAVALGTRDAWLVAAGAALFMTSDTMISINRFVLPFGWSNVAIMATYYAGQILILRHALVARRHDGGR
jgi:alkylglycerol monooxygenase